MPKAKKSGGELLPLFGSDRSLGLRIKSVRLYEQMNQSEFADALGVSQGYLSEVERDKGKPTIEMVVGISQCFSEIDPGWLLNGQGNMVRGLPAGSISLIEKDGGTVSVMTPPRSKRKS